MGERVFKPKSESLGMSTFKTLKVILVTSSGCGSLS